MEHRTWQSPRYWGAWLLAGSYNFLQFGLGPQWGVALAFTYSHFFVWGVLGLAVLPLARRFPLRQRWPAWVLHGVLGALFTLADIFTGHLIFSALTGVYAELAMADLFVMAFKSCFHLGLLTYWGFIGIINALDLQKLARQRQVRIAEQQTELVRAQLHSLKIQLQPHFLFNTLHSIGALMHHDIATAERMLNRLSDLLRRSLQDAGTLTVSLRHELAFAQAYLDIEQLRFEERLRVVCQVPDALLAHPVPPFILQPLVENAVKYGVAPRAEGGTITIRAYAQEAWLVLEVRDDAPEALAARKGFGIGLRNTRERLDTLYGDAVQFELRREDGYTVARMRMPAGAAVAPRATVPEAELGYA